MKKDVLKFEEFIKEAKEAQDKKESKKDKAVELLKKLLKSKTVIKMGEKWPEEKGIYSLAGIKRYFKDNGMTNDDAGQAVHVLQNEKGGEMKYVKVRNFFYGNDSYPYYYITLSDTDANEAKKKMEEWSKEQAKPEIEKKKELAKKDEAVKKLKAEESKAKRARKTTTPKTGEKPKTTKPRTKRK